MGHYRSEMFCNNCGKYICTCTKPKIKPFQTFYIDDDFGILCFDEKTSLSGGKFLEYMSRTHFNTLEEASAMRDIMLVVKIKTLEVDLTKLKILQEKFGATA